MQASSAGKAGSVTCSRRAAPFSANPPPYSANSLQIGQFPGIPLLQCAEFDNVQESRLMHAPIKYEEKGMAVAANGIWQVFSVANRIKQNPSFTPRWSDKPLLKSHQKTKPPLGWPRETDSLCPICTREARQEILDGKKDVSILLNEKVGEIKATILERDGQILMV